MHAHRSLETPHNGFVTGLASVANGRVAVTMQSDAGAAPTGAARLQLFDCRPGADRALLCCCQPGQRQAAVAVLQCRPRASLLDLDKLCTRMNAAALARDAAPLFMLDRGS